MSVPFNPVYMAPLPPTVLNWQSVFYMYLVLGVAGGIFAYGLMLAYILRGRRRSNPTRIGGKSGGRGNLYTLIVVTGIVIAAFVAGVEGNSFMWSTPQNLPTLTITVHAYQWGWNFTYPDGYTSTDTLTVPVNTTIILNVTSEDVFHDLGIPMFDVKADAIPGQWDALWFVATETGSYPYAIRCYELCGAGHAYMTANLTVLTHSEFSSWYAQHSGSQR
ncbi:MAG: cytochrome c oxidase subunit II [Thermoprotei archaeon]